MKMAAMTARQGTVPQQAYNGFNILGTPSPLVGDQKGNPNYSAGVGQTQANKYNVVIVAGVIIAVGYILYHVSFELSGRVSE